MLESLPPDSDKQQAHITAIQNEDGYNWGYDLLFLISSLDYFQWFSISFRLIVCFLCVKNCPVYLVQKKATILSYGESLREAMQVIQMARVVQLSSERWFRFTLFISFPLRTIGILLVFSAVQARATVVLGLNANVC